MIRKNFKYKYYTKVRNFFFVNKNVKYFHRPKYFFFRRKLEPVNIYPKLKKKVLKNITKRGKSLKFIKISKKTSYFLSKSRKKLIQYFPSVRRRSLQELILAKHGRAWDRLSRRIKGYKSTKTRFPYWKSTYNYFRKRRLDYFTTKIHIKKRTGRYPEGKKIRSKIKVSLDLTFRILFGKRHYRTKTNTTIRWDFLADKFFSNILDLSFVLSSLNVYRSSFQVNQKMLYGNVLVNNTRLSGVKALNAGDIVEYNELGYYKLERTCIRRHLKLNNERRHFRSSYLSFLEIDDYSQTLVIVKGNKELSREDLILINSPVSTFSKPNYFRN